MALPTPESVESAINARADASAGSQSSDTAPTDTQSSAAPESKGNTAEDVLNLEGVMKFKFGEREWTPEQLRKAIMFQQDYTKKTQGVAETKKYFDNLQHDLDKVRKNPELAAEFQKVYPKEFHQYLNLLKSGSSEAQNLQTQQQYAQIDPKIAEEFNQIKEFVQNTQVEKYEAQLDAKFATLTKKYPEAIEDVVLARAQALMDKGVAISDSTWESLFKQSHESIVKKFEEKQKGVLTNQRNANNSAKGPSSGGGVPTQAPKRETMAQATERAIRELSNRG